jgi:Tetratrico peptide repeat
VIGMGDFLKINAERFGKSPTWMLVRRCEAVPVNEAEWEQWLRHAWASIDQQSEAECVAVVEQLTAELPPDNAIEMFERASALDSTGHPNLAAPLYRQALIGDSLANVAAVR